MAGVVPVDFNATQYLNGNYTIRARAQIKLGGETATRDLLAVSTVNNLSKIDLPPALNIILPAFYDADVTKDPVNAPCLPARARWRFK